MSALKELDLTEFEGLNTYDVNGYTAYYLPKHHLANKSGKVYEHMIAAEQMLGRRLKPEEVVHHKDKNRKNNSFDNLIVFKTNFDHSAYHQGRDIVLEDDVYVAVDKYQHEKNANKNEGKFIVKNKCSYCGNLKCYTAKMCLDCHNKYRVRNIPSREDLYNLLRDNSMCAIGKIYNDVSDNAVRRWCKKYGLPFNRSDIEKFREEEFGIIKEVKEKCEPTPCKAVVMLDINSNELLKSFASIGEARRYIGDEHRGSHISDVCNGKRKTAYGYKWKWLDDLL